MASSDVVVPIIFNLKVAMFATQWIRVGAGKATPRLIFWTVKP